MTSSLAAIGQGEKPDGPIAHTALGGLRGLFRDGIAAFHGVPYAAPPVGEARFAAAPPVRPWNGLFDATRHGPIAPQLPARLRAAMGEEPFQRQDEDCLTLTICTPAPGAGARPVLVWLHGGAWLSGSGSDARLDGARLAREGDIVFVSVNYRLGALGWLHRTGIVDAEPGLSDMIAALGWVRDHIAGFGGDQKRVTLMGQSAGATSIGRLLMLPEARSLFQRVILQSGGFGRGFCSRTAATELADQFMRLLDIDPGAGDALSRLRAIEVPRLLKAQADFARSNARFARNTPPFMPVIPEAITEAATLAAIATAAGRGSEFGGKDVLIGATADEMHAFLAADPAMESPPADAVATRFGDPEILAHYRARRPGATDMDLLADLGTDETYLRPTMRLADEIATGGGNVHAYYFDWAPQTSRFRSCHTIELPFVFGAIEAWREAPMLAGGDALQMSDLSHAMRRAWLAFARDGAPGHDGLPAWPRYDTMRRPVMRFGTRIGIVGDPAGLG